MDNYLTLPAFLYNVSRMQVILFIHYLSTDLYFKKMVTNCRKRQEAELIIVHPILQAMCAGASVIVSYTKIEASGNMPIKSS